MEELFWVHCPVSKIISGPSGSWGGLQMDLSKRKGSRHYWAVSKRVISYDKLKWVVFSFQLYKSPGIDGIMLIILQQAFELLVGIHLMLLRVLWH
jgi:hypothetical protein